MKRYTYTLIIALIALQASMANAQSWFRAEVKIHANNTRGTAEVINQLGRPIFCEGYVVGRTVRGVELNSWFSHWVPEYSLKTIWVSTDWNDPFTAVYDNIQCRF